MNTILQGYFFIFWLSTSISSQLYNYEVYYECIQVDYNFPNDSIRTELLANGGFIPINCIPTGVKIYNNMLFIATPRYGKGVPSTLNVISYRKSYFTEDHSYKRNQGPKLTPFPSWEMQEIGNCSALQNVQTMELDIYNRLWILDVGRPALLTSAPQNLCPAKLVIFDLVSNKIERTYQFPNEVVPRDTNVIKDIQVACTSRQDCISYIANLNVTCNMVVYDYKNNDSWFATHSTMQPDPEKETFTINGVSATVPFGITGIGLTPRSTDYSTIYFSRLAGDHIYAVPTSYLKNGTALKENPVLPDNAVRDLGAKPIGQADGTAMDNFGRWYFGSLPESAVYNIDTSGNPNEIHQFTREVQSAKDLQWPDAFSFDGVGNLLFTATRFQLFNAKLFNPNEVNFRLIKFRTDSVAYWAA